MQPNATRRRARLARRSANAPACPTIVAAPAFGAGRIQTSRPSLPAVASDRIGCAANRRPGRSAPALPRRPVRCTALVSPLSFAAQPDPLSRLDAYVASTFEWVRRSPVDARFWLLFYYFCANDRGIRAVNTGLASMGHARLTQLLLDGARLRVFAPTDLAAPEFQALLSTALHNLAAT